MGCWLSKVCLHVCYLLHLLLLVHVFTYLSIAKTFTLAISHSHLIHPAVRVLMVVVPNGGGRGEHAAEGVHRRIADLT